jgi:hypothetical protein
MEPSIIVAVVSAAGKVLEKAIGLFANRDPKSEAEVAGVIQKAYDPLKQNLTGGSVRVLKMLESGSLLYPQMIRERYYPDVKLPDDAMTVLDHEFGYRLEYLRQNGVLTQVAGREYGITRLGAAFLAEARRRHDYYEELFGNQ